MSQQVGWGGSNMKEFDTNFDIDILSYLYDGGLENLRWVSLLSGKRLVAHFMTDNTPLISLFCFGRTFNDFVRNTLPFQSLRL